MLKKIISGGQTGVDQAGLRQARLSGIPTGGTAPLGWMTETGPAPWLADYGLKQCTARGYPPRTYENVKYSSGTVIFGDDKSPGSISTIFCCKSANKLYIINPTAEELIAWIYDNNIEVLNVAGNRQSKLTDEKLLEITRVLKEVFDFFAKLNET